MDDEKALTAEQLCEVVEHCEREKRGLLDELHEIRPMARLANLLSIQEGDNMRWYRRSIRAERDYDDAVLEIQRLKVRLEGAEELLRGFESKLGQ
jgi:hypothetical protein